MIWLLLLLLLLYVYWKKVYSPLVMTPCVCHTSVPCAPESVTMLCEESIVHPTGYYSAAATNLSSGYPALTCRVGCRFFVLLCLHFRLFVPSFNFVSPPVASGGLKMTKTRPRTHAENLGCGGTVVCDEDISAWGVGLAVRSCCVGKQTNTGLETPCGQAVFQNGCGP